MSIIDIVALSKEHERLLDSHTELHEKYHKLLEKYGGVVDRYADRTTKFNKLTNLADALSEQVRKATVGNFTTHEGFIVLTSYQQFKQECLEEKEKNL